MYGKKVSAFLAALMIAVQICLIIVLVFDVRLLFHVPAEPPAEPEEHPVESNDPVITVKDTVIAAGKFFNPLSDVAAKDVSGTDLTDRVTVSGTLNTAKVGRYRLTYSVTDDFGRTATRRRTVTVLENEYLGLEVPDDQLPNEGEGDELYFEPLSARFDIGGLWLDTLCVGYAEMKPYATAHVIDNRDNFVSAVISDTDKVDKLTVFLAQGAPYGYFTYAEPEKATLYCDNLIAVYDVDGNEILTDEHTYVGDCVVVRVGADGERCYVVNAPKDTVFSLTDGTVSAAMTEGNYLSVGLMSSSDGEPNFDEAALMHEHGYAFVFGVGADNRLQTMLMRVGYSHEAYVQPKMRKK